MMTNHQPPLTTNHQLHPPPQVIAPSASAEDVRSQEATNRSANQAKLIAAGILPPLLSLCLAGGGAPSAVIRAQVLRGGGGGPA